MILQIPFKINNNSSNPINIQCVSLVGYKNNQKNQLKSVDLLYFIYGYQSYFVISYTPIIKGK